MSNNEFPSLPENVHYIGLDGTPVNEDSPFPDVRLGDREVVEEGELSFGYKRGELVDHYEDHIRDLKNGLYDNRWPSDKVEMHRSEEIGALRLEINYLKELKADTVGKAYVELWFRKLNQRQEQAA